MVPIVMTQTAAITDAATIMMVTAFKLLCPYPSTVSLEVTAARLFASRAPCRPSAG
jgi:hypothetical protein